MHKIYVASKLHHWEKWLKWEDANVQHVKIVSRWVNVMRYHKSEEEIIRYTTPEYAQNGWRMNIEDVKDADILVVYAEDEVLRGALVEVGAALALGKKIVLVGESESYSEWKYSWNVIAHVDTLEQVIPTLETIYKGW